MSVYKRGDRWAVKVRIGGTQKWVGTFSTRRLARDAEAKYLAHYQPAQESGLTCDAFADSWTTSYPRERASTNRQNAHAVKKFGEDFTGRLLSDLTRPAARKWALEHPSRVSAVRAMYSDAVNDGLVSHNPFANLKLKQSPGRKNLIVPTVDEVHGLAETARALHGEHGEEFAALIIFAAYTCMRPGEIVVLEWDDVNFDENEIVVSKTLSGDREVTLPKNGRVRRIVLPPVARDALRRVPRRLDTDRIFSTKRGRRFSKSNFHYAFNPVRCAFGRPDMDFYELRHFGCTFLLDELGLTPGDAAHQLGHTDGGRLVMELYGHPAEDRTRERIKQAFKRASEAGGVTSITDAPSQRQL